MADQLHARRAGDPPGRAWGQSCEGSPGRPSDLLPGDRSDSLEILERLVNKTSLSTQRVTHLNILALGDELLTTKRRRRKPEVARPAGPPTVEILEEEESDDESTSRLEQQLTAARSLAEEEKKRALQEQKETFTKMLEEVARNRDHLEAERLGQFRRKLEREWAEALQAQRRRFEAETQHAVAAACAGLRQQVCQEVEQERSRDIEEALAAAAGDFLKQMEAAVQDARAECRMQAEEGRSTMLHRQALEAQKLQDAITGLQHEIFKLLQEKRAYEWQFREVQLNFKRFIDLTESSLHSDYLLRLRCLGKPPGYADAGIQTDEVITAQDHK